MAFRKPFVAFKMRVLVILPELLSLWRGVSVTWKPLFVKMFLSMHPMIFRKVDLSFKKTEQWRGKWTDVLISLPQLQIGLIESWKLCLNLCLWRWLKHNLNLVNNWTPMGIWQLKTVLPEARMKFEKVFVKIFKPTELQIFRSSLFHSITPEGKKGIFKEIMLYFE